MIYLCDTIAVLVTVAGERSIEIAFEAVCETDAKMEAPEADLANGILAEAAAKMVAAEANPANDVLAEGAAQMEAAKKVSAGQLANLAMADVDWKVPAVNRSVKIDKPNNAIAAKYVSAERLRSCLEECDRCVCEY